MDEERAEEITGLMTGGATTHAIADLAAGAGAGWALAVTQTTLVTSFLVLAGLAMLLMPAGARLLRRLRQAPNAPPSVHDRVDGFSRVARDKDSLETLMKDVRELTRLCAQQLDSRAERLEKLLAEADRRVNRLERLTSDADSRDGAPLVEVRRGAADASFQWPAVRPSGGMMKTGEHHSAPIDPVARQVYDLSDQGHTPVQIAGALEEHVGKVELILALRG